MSNKTVLQALTLYKEQISSLKKGYKQESYRIGQISKSFLGDREIATVTSVDIATYRDARLNTVNPRTDKALSPASVRLEMSLLSNFFDICRIEWGFCESNPVANVRKPKPPPGRDRRLTPREDRQILRYSFQHQNTSLFSIIVLALETAMRQGEILSLKWEHINLKSRIAHLPMTKNGTKRDVPLSLKARDAIIRMGVKTEGNVFGYTSNGLKSTWRFMTLKLGIQNMHFHDLRHEAVSRLFELGTLDMMEIAAISGHKSLSMLKRYTHLSAQKLVKKLEGGRSKGKQVVLQNLIPYPALLKKDDFGYSLRLLDFDDITVVGENMDSAIRSAQDALLRKLVTSLANNLIDIPQPDQYLETVNEKDVVLINPLVELESC